MNSLTNLPPLKPGYWWWNVAPLGEKPDWQQQVKPADVDPNRIDKIFGYETESFLKRQYR